MDGVVDGGCDNCRPLMPGGLPGGEWNPWQEDYDRDGMGDACDPCPFHFSPPNAPCVGPPLFPEPEVWTGIAVTTMLAELPIYGSERIGLLRPNALRDTSFYLGAIFTRQVGKKEYELKDHLGNVRVVVSDLKGKEGTAMFARVKSVNSYYAFGMLEEGMSGSSGGYRYGYNGKEMDNELKGEGNSVDYGARMYDPRLGRWGSVDPLYANYPELTPYNFALNTPIWAMDPDGKLVVFANGYRIKNFWKDLADPLNVIGLDGREEIYTRDQFNYWNNFDFKMQTRLGDFNPVYVDASSRITSSAEYRYNRGIEAGKELLKQIDAGKVSIQRNDEGKPVETIKIVAHSQGVAYGAGMAEVLINAGYEVEVIYGLAPKQPKSIQIPKDVKRSVQYSSLSDFIAPQTKISTVHEWQRDIVPEEKKKVTTGGGHTMNCYHDPNSPLGGGVFDLKPNDFGYVAPRMDIGPLIGNDISNFNDIPVNDSDPNTDGSDGIVRVGPVPNP